MIASVRAPSLVEAAATRLRTGPASTIELARDVLRVAGPPGPVAAAVHALLGADERFCVDGSGTWSFDDGRAGPDLATLDFAVVDVETTGGSFAAGHRIVEIAVVPVSGGQIGGVWSTLVNPGRLLPRAVQSLTGIGDSVVLDAPYFDHVADEVSARLAGRVFRGTQRDLRLALRERGARARSRVGTVGAEALHGAPYAPVASESPPTKPGRRHAALRDPDPGPAPGPWRRSRGGSRTASSSGRSQKEGNH